MSRIALLALLCAAALYAQPASTPPKQQSPLRFDPANIDKAANPCVDFYQYACGTWITKNPIPPDQSRWGRFSELEERNRAVLREILDEASKPAPNRDAVSTKIGDYYAACMDEKAIDARGLAPIEPELARIRNLKDKAQLAAEIAHLHRNGVDSLFEFGSGPDFKDASTNLAQADQGGLGLPDRDYYLKDDAKSEEIRQKYVAHVQKIFELSGEKPEQAKADAARVMRLETALAKGSLDLVSRRDPEKQYHKMTTRELEALSPQFQWNQYLKDTNAPGFSNINVVWPDFFKAMNSELQNSPSGRLEDVSHLAPAALRSAAAAHSVRTGEFQFLRQDPDRLRRDAAALEALRGVHRRATGRSAGPEVRGTHFRQGRQGAHAEDGGRAGKGAGRRTLRASPG